VVKRGSAAASPFFLGRNDVIGYFVIIAVLGALWLAYEAV